MPQEIRRPVIGTGVPEIDAGHEGLAFLLAHVFEPGVECRRHANGGCDHSDCSKIGALLSFLSRNFDAEETLTDRGECPDADAHRADHFRLLEVLRGMQADSLCAERDHAVVRHAIERWAARHHFGADHRLARWLLTRRLLPAAAE